MFYRIQKQKIMDKQNFTISFSWDVNHPDNAERVGAMYCFKMCDVNVN